VTITRGQTEFLFKIEHAGNFKVAKDSLDKMTACLQLHLKLLFLIPRSQPRIVDDYPRDNSFPYMVPRWELKDKEHPALDGQERAPETATSMEGPESRDWRVRRLGLWSSFAQTNIVRVNYAVGADEMWQAVSQPVHRGSPSEGDGYGKSNWVLRTCDLS
jgi:hypothetical protein